MKLQTLIKNLIVISVTAETDREIIDVNFDSRKVKEGHLFVAIRGTGFDGHDYITSALDAGAIAIVCEEMPSKIRDEITYIRTENSREALAQIAASWYGNPSQELKLVGITGTNGKTTIATLLYKVNTGLGYKAGILTTIEVIINNKSYPATHTTPDPLQINMWLREMVDQGCEYCFMEVSSHALSQCRVSGLEFNGAIFSNLTHDHLDYHKDFREYLEVKKSFFDHLDNQSFALTNLDDKNGEIMLQNCDAQKFSYGLKRLSDYHGKILEARFEGMELMINGREVWLRLTGRFNAYNILAVYGACLLLGHDENQVLEQLSLAGAAEGRFEIIKGETGSIVIVDYAHTDDALRNVLETIQEVNRDKKQIITVVGAGGDRDTSKRPKMGSIAVSLSNKVILTSDNPRFEDAQKIIDDMAAGIPEDKLNSVLKINEREEAIKTACMMAAAGSIILIAGKGHEKYQDIKGVKKPFDDKEIVKKYLK